MAMQTHQCGAQRAGNSVQQRGHVAGGHAVALLQYKHIKAERPVESRGCPGKLSSSDRHVAGRQAVVLGRSMFTPELSTACCKRDRGYCEGSLIAKGLKSTASWN